MLLQMEGISKSFPGVRALDGVSLELAAGEVLGLVGENGAGKSTLMKILAGLYRPDQGRLVLNGRPYAPQRPGEALAAGVVVIPQELSLVPDRSVAENIYLGHLPRTPLGTVRRGELGRAARALMARLGLGGLSPWARVADLGIAQQQLVEIARALSRCARVLVLDEPTSTLTETEVAILAATVRQLRAEGVGMIFISHHLEEVLTLCDRVTVLRDGRTVATRTVREWTMEGIVQAMVDRPLSELFPKQPVARGRPLLEVRDLAARGRFADVSFTLHAGEIVGLAGLIGAGRTEVLKAIFGAMPKVTGEVRLHGRPLRARRPRAMLAQGVALVPEDRKREGLILPFGVQSNIVLSSLERTALAGVVTLPHRARRLAQRMVDAMGVRTPRLDQAVGRLSGGNQQKVVLGRVMTLGPSVFLLDEPTRGIDVGAKAEVYAMVGRLAAEGAGVLVVSSELLELLGLCDRILVMRAGRLVGETPRAEFDQERIMHMAALG